MKASVVMTTYNGEKYLSDQLESLLTQTYPLYEVLIFDDISSDNSVKIIKDFIKNYHLEESWKVIQNTVNKGYERNFYDGINSATGDVIFFCDQDDIWECDKIESMVSVLSKNENIKVLASNLTPFYSDSDARKWGRKELKEMKQDKTVMEVKFNKNNFHLKRSGCTMCIRKEYFSNIKDVWVDGWAHDDFAWKLSLFDEGCSIYQYSTIKRRMHSNNTTNIRGRNVIWRINQLKGILKQYEIFFNHGKVNYKDENVEKLKIINKNIKATKMRIKMFEERKIFLWLVLAINYRDCYPRIKGLPLDLYLLIFKTYK